MWDDKLWWDYYFQYLSMDYVQYWDRSKCPCCDSVLANGADKGCYNSLSQANIGQEMTRTRPAMQPSFGMFVYVTRPYHSQFVWPILTRSIQSESWQVCDWVGPPWPQPPPQGTAAGIWFDAVSQVKDLNLVTGWWFHVWFQALVGTIPNDQYVWG